MKILLYGNPILRTICVSVADVDSDIVKTLDDMGKILGEYKGIGLAAPQISQSVRMFVFQDNRKKLRQIINPIIIKARGSTEDREGCLSIPGISVPVFRPSTVELEYVDRCGKKKREKFTGMDARVIQHENDHLDGKMILDLVPAKQQEIIINAVKNFRSFGLV